MPYPEFDQAKLRKLIALVAPYLAAPDKMAELEANLRSVEDPPDYLRRVADLGSPAASNLISAALLGLAVAVLLDDLTDHLPSPSVN